VAEVQPLLDAAALAVGALKNEHLSEVRSLKAPPAAVRDVLEAVLRLMGQPDTSWNAMRRFLATAGVKERIMGFDARGITPTARAVVERILTEHADSFAAERIARVSVAAAPLAVWVQVRATRFRWLGSQRERLLRLPEPPVATACGRRACRRTSSTAPCSTTSRR
jgi:dynein heavy chain 2, cytosolic